MKEYKELENKKDIPALNREIEEEIEEDDDEDIELLEKLLAQKRARKKNKYFEMWISKKWQQMLNLIKFILYNLRKGWRDYLTLQPFAF